MAVLVIGYFVRRIAYIYRAVVAAVGQVLQPFSEEGVHPQAVPDQLGGRRVHADDVLPATTDVAVGRFELARVVVLAQVRGRVGFAGDRIGHAVAQAQFGGVAVLLQYVHPQVQSVADAGHVPPLLHPGGLEETRQAVVVLGVQRHQPSETAQRGDAGGAGGERGHGSMLHAVAVPRQH